MYKKVGPGFTRRMTLMLTLGNVHADQRERERGGKRERVRERERKEREHSEFKINVPGMCLFH